MSKLKEELVNKLQQIITERLLNAKQAMDSAADSRDNETKSSVGDKYETGRAMMQEEYDRNKVSYLKAKQLEGTLKEIKFNTNNSHVEPGSLVHTSLGVYFISIGIGKIHLGTDTIFCLSAESPLGKMLLNKKTGYELRFMNKSYLIQKIE